MKDEDDLFELMGVRDDAIPANASPSPPKAPLGTRLREYLARQYSPRPPASAGATTKVQPIGIDDRDAGDVYPAFCQIIVTVPDTADGLFLLKLLYPPHDAEVEELITGKGGRVGQLAAGPCDLPVTLRVHIRPKDAPFLRKLARAVRRVTGRGRSYVDPNWKWLAPRTAASLERLAQHLDEFRRSAR
jgi:hypothetical protein